MKICPYCQKPFQANDYVEQGVFELQNDQGYVYLTMVFHIVCVLRRLVNGICNVARPNMEDEMEIQKLLSEGLSNLNKDITKQ